MYIYIYIYIRHVQYVFLCALRLGLRPLEPNELPAHPETTETTTLPMVPYHAHSRGGVPILAPPPPKVGLGCGVPPAHRNERFSGGRSNIVEMRMKVGKSKRRPALLINANANADSNTIILLRLILTTNTDTDADADADTSRWRRRPVPAGAAARAAARPPPAEADHARDPVEPPSHSEQLCVCVFGLVQQWLGNQVSQALLDGDAGKLSNSI